MTVRLAYLGNQLSRFLSRYEAPAMLTGQPRDDEVAALVRALDRAAPTTDYDAWWARFEDVLAENLRARSWPTVRDVAQAAQKMPRTARTAQATPPGDAENGDQAQLRTWLAGKQHCAEHLITVPALATLGVPHREAEAKVTGMRRGILPGRAGDPGCTCDICKARQRHAG
jgi:hypothetical protein